MVGVGGFMPMLLLVLLSGGTAWMTHNYLSDKAAREGSVSSPMPTILGYDSTKLMVGIGIGSLILGTPLIAAIGIGAALGAVITRGTVAMASEAYTAGAGRPMLSQTPTATTASVRTVAPARRAGGFLQALYQRMPGAQAQA